MWAPAYPATVGGAVLARRPRERSAILMPCIRQTSPAHASCQRRLLGQATARPHGAGEDAAGLEREAVGTSAGVRRFATVGRRATASYPAARGWLIRR